MRTEVGIVEAIYSASSAPDVLKAVVRANENNAGVYRAVTRIGRLAVGQTSMLCRGAHEPRPESHCSRAG